MPLYKNLSGNSNVISYEIGDDRIFVTFPKGVTYEYTYGSAGLSHIENMKSLAIQGRGLNGYVNTHVKNKYARKF